MLGEQKYIKVSVIMCTFNGEEYICSQLDSILNQTYPIHELLIQDDCSTDKTFSILEEYHKKNPFIRIFRNFEQKGINKNFFSAMEKATGDYIAISDQDDIWELDKIEKQINSIGDNWLSTGFSQPFSTNSELLEFDKRIPNLKAERLIHVASAVPGHTILMKRDLLSYLICENYSFILYDQLLSIIASSFNKISFCESVLVKHREHIASATYTLPVMQRNGNNRNLVNILKSIYRTFFLYVELRRKIRMYFGEMYLLLRGLPEVSSKKYAEQIALWHSKKGIKAYLSLTLLCIRRRKYLFHVIESNNFFTFLRALYFPISCSDYFRYMSKRYK
ncbi:glycosyltransferase [Parabacteroides sp. OttesenSCG-928-G07]|nr:glycosyltransferase [Parabacteroides sp. OttesenSCG-928-G21]MDL2277819.1 glycosyltransferase [Parabacteroides sp. OttesenSCG-928-G07]